MIETRYYKVAGHTFGVSGEGEIFALMTNYEPFSCEGRKSDETLFALRVGKDETVGFTEDLRQEDEGQIIVCGRTSNDNPAYEFIWCCESAGQLVCTNHYHDGQLILTGQHAKMAIDNALMVLFAQATADKNTVLFHAAVVSLEGKGYMLLGKSGTGKSTHARLWLQHIDGTELMNDDNPVVRISNGQAVVYGSPWSGKTPCYRNVNCPLGAIVHLSQAPYNKMSKLGGIPAYAVLVASISGQRWDESIADGLHQTENELVSNVPMWHLECLPDKEAATLCQMTITL